MGPRWFLRQFTVVRLCAFRARRAGCFDGAGAANCIVVCTVEKKLYIYETLLLQYSSKALYAVKHPFAVPWSWMTRKRLTLAGGKVSQFCPVSTPCYKRQAYPAYF